MGDADDAVVLDLLTSLVGEREDAELILGELRSMPDKGPLARSLGITPGDLGLIHTWVLQRNMTDYANAWVEP